MFVVHYTKTDVYSGTILDLGNVCIGKVAQTIFFKRYILMNCLLDVFSNVLVADKRKIYGSLNLIAQAISI